jgi:DNA-binding MarR family transcriptional regulator
VSRDSRERLIREVADAIRAHGTAQDLLDEAAAARLGINRTDARVLDVLERSGEVTAGAIARQTGLTTGAITVLLDRLERASYVRRTRDKEDRRRVLVEITAKARKQALELYGPIGEEAHGQLEDYSDQELRLLSDHHLRGAELLTRHALRIKAETSAKRRRGQTRRRTIVPGEHHGLDR